MTDAEKYYDAARDANADLEAERREAHDTSQMQADFETWMQTGQHPDITAIALEKLSDGSYKSQLTFAAWKAWQAAHREFDWRGIETAPLDGRWIAGLGNDGSIYRISWGRNYNNVMAWCTSFSSFVPGYITYWMPLPKLPKPETN